eukprot:c1717_g1_i1.p1 GENE.c1717_g1_i1~~c1717_g1_i1.p1  ORF type:complete len:339 (+),score=112.97 c1717_g1_i1:27-1043(+)
METGGSFQSIPLFDVDELFEKKSQSEINRLRNVCHDIGFFYITNHGISKEFLAETFYYTRWFFDLSLEEKEKTSILLSPQYRGYGRYKQEMTLGKPDYKETVDLGYELNTIEFDEKTKYLKLQGPNQWPLSEDLNDINSPAAKFKSHMLEYISKVHHLSKKLLSLMARCLGLSENFFDPFFNLNSIDAFAMLRLLRYPAQLSSESADTSVELGVGPHIDQGCLVILLQDLPGLQVQNNKGEWIDANPIEGTFVVNIGKMLQVWSNNYFVATVHRVLGSKTVTRHSIPYFAEPSLSTVVLPAKISDELLKDCHQHVDKIESAIYGEQMLAVFERSFPKN